MKKIVNSLLASFDNHSQGYSGRKLTAFALMVCIAWIHFKLITPELAIEAMIVDLCGVMLSLGLVTASNLIELKNGKSNTDKPEGN